MIAPAPPRTAPRDDRRWFWLVPLLLLPLPAFLNQYQQYVVNMMLMYVPVGVGFNLVVGNLGLLAFSNVAFFGIGAYATGVLMVQLGMPWWLTVVPAGLMGALAGGAASVAALRGVRCFYLAIMTLAFGELMRWVYIRWEPVTGGSMGMAVPTPDVFGWRLVSEGRKFYVFLALAVLVVVATARLLRTRFGRAFMAIRSNEAATAAMGIPTARYIMLCFGWSGFVVGHRRGDVRGPGRPPHAGLVRSQRTAARIRDHHGGRPRQPARLGDRCRRHHRGAAGVRRSSGLPGTRVRRADHPRACCSCRTAWRACWRASIPFSATATIMTRCGAAARDRERERALRRPGRGRRRLAAAWSAARSAR